MMMMMTMKTVTTVMKVCVLLLCVCSVTSARRLQLGSCHVSVHTHELRQHFLSIRQSVVTQDTQIGIRLLRSDILKDVQGSQSCCFLRHLLRFYVERVFGSPAATHTLQQRTTGVLANAFLSIKKDLRQCHDQMHCQCGEQSRLKMEAILASFDKLEPKAATVKAVGELGVVLEWLESFHTSRDVPSDAMHG
ncbi:interleukin 19 like [Sardina pilchardus]|uniref:interleukin 19 like n=1 Tax=Sardina pilchardus TaxID=27697 RepID=UPI002E136F99